MKRNTRPASPRPSIPVFVYGTLKQGHGNHRLLAEGNATFCGSAVTLESYPLHVEGLPFLRNSPGEGHPVKGELYLVDAQTFARLDALEGHPQFYRREEIQVRGKAGVSTAWVYFIQRGSQRIAQLPMVAEYQKPLAMR